MTIETPEQKARQQIDTVINEAFVDGPSLAVFETAATAMEELEEKDPAAFHNFKDEADARLTVVGIRGAVNNSNLRCTIGS